MKTLISILILTCSLVNHLAAWQSTTGSRDAVETEAVRLPMLNLDVTALANGRLYPPHGGPLSIPTSGGASISFNLGVIEPSGHTGALLLSRRIVPWLGTAGAGTAQNTPVSVDIPVRIANARHVYVLLNSTQGFCGRVIGELSFVGADGYRLRYPIRVGQNIRDHNRSGYCGTLTLLSGSVEYGHQVRFDMQDFEMNERLAHQALAKIVFTATPPPGDTSAPFITAISVAGSGRSGETVARGNRGETGALESALDLLATNAKKYSKYVSKAICQETAHSEQTGFNRGPVHLVLDTRAEFSVPDIKDPYKEERVFTSKNGSPADPHSPGGPLLYKVEGAFGPPLSTYFAPEHRACLHFDYSRGKVSFEALPGVAGKGLCAAVAPMAKGYVTFDPATGAVDHLERTVPNNLAGQSGFAALGIIDFSPVSFPGINYQLPVHIHAERRVGQLDLKFDASYSGCRLLDSSSTIIYEQQP